ncbi:MAG: hypothetical protein KDJ65_26660 [Anaerolineae bacterium]|nr:hypothetical protein [Anaerolineae bacterium]
MARKKEPAVMEARRTMDGTKINWTDCHNCSIPPFHLQQIDDSDLDRLMAIAVERADAAPDRRAPMLRVWSALKNEQRRRERLPALAGLPEAGPDEVTRFLDEVAAR